MTKVWYNQYEIKSQPLITGNFCPLFAHQIRYMLPDYSWSDWHLRECVDRPDAVVVVPFDPLTKRIVFIEQFRIGAVQKSNNPWLWEIVAGLIEKGETPETTARREIKEEIGLDLKQLFLLQKAFVSPGYSNEQTYFYLGIVDTQRLTTTGGKKEENEYLYLHSLSLEETCERLKNQFFNNSATILALQALLTSEILTTLNS